MGIYETYLRYFACVPVITVVEAKSTVVQDCTVRALEGGSYSGAQVEGGVAEPEWAD